MKIAVDAMGGDFAPEAVVDGVFAQGREIRRIHPLFLNPQDHHHVRAFDRVFDVRRNLQIAFDEMLEIRRHERFRSGDANARAEFG